MPRNRAPQNSASSCHHRFFSDLQTVYQKIIQTNGASFPFRSKDSRRSLHTAPANSRNRQALAVSNSVFASRTPSACSSVEEIIIKPLHFHDRLAYTSCSSRCHPTSMASSEVGSQMRSRLDSDSAISAHNESRLARVRSRSSLAVPIEYSDQSIRYVTEQISLEQARQLKLRSSVKQHRVDRRYFVSGSKMHIQKQAFEETHDNMLQLNCENQLNTAKIRHCRRARIPTVKHSSRNVLTTTEKHVQDAVCGISLKQEDTDIDISVAIPTASETDKPPSAHSNNNVNAQVNISVEPSDEYANPLTLDSPA